MKPEKRIEREKIRLLVEEDGQKLWRTLKGVMLVGAAGLNGEALLGQVSGEREKWDFDMWYVIQADNGKLVVYRQPFRRDAIGTIQVFSSFEAMQPAIPPDIFQQAELATGRGHRLEYPEAPLDV